MEPATTGRVRTPSGAPYERLPTVHTCTAAPHPRATSVLVLPSWPPTHSKGIGIGGQPTRHKRKKRITSRAHPCVLWRQFAVFVPPPPPCSQNVRHKCERLFLASSPHAHFGSGNQPKGHTALSMAYLGAGFALAPTRKGNEKRARQTAPTFCRGAGPHR